MGARRSERRTRLWARITTWPERSAVAAQDGGAFYTISFDPPRANTSSEYHELKVKIGKPKLTARTNTGYYNQP